MSPRSRIRFAAAGVVCIGLAAGWYFSTEWGKEQAISRNQARPQNRPAKMAGERLFPTKFTSAEGGGTFDIALDEICIKGADGAEIIVRLDPPATPETFRTRIAAFAPKGEILPIAYAEGRERDESGRRLVTRKMRVKIPPGAEGRLAADNALTVSERPSYAPEWVILEAADPLAALAAVDSVRASRGVESADVLTGRKRFTRAMPNDTFIANQWHLKNTVASPSISHANVEGAWNYPAATGIRGNGIRIGIVDDGLQTAHPDLITNVDTVNDWDWNGNDADPNPTPYSIGTNVDRHGTACAGVAGARGNNGLGVSGVAPEATLVGMRLIAGSPTDADEAGALSWKDDIIQVKSNSWGPNDYIKAIEGPQPLTAAAFQNMATSGRGGKGTIFIWAAGNGGQPAYEDNSNFDGYANSIYTIAVGALERTGYATDYTEPGANVLITAPAGDRDTVGTWTTDRTGVAGYNTLSTANGGDYYSRFDGTSSATPVVSGVVALMLQKNPNLGWRDVQEILFRSATKVVPSDADWKTNGAGFSFHHQFGGGLVNATAAVDLAGTWVNLPSQTSLSSTHASSVTIPNNNATGASKTFTFSQTNHRVEAVTVQLAASHSARGNLAITLTSPSGTVSRLTEVRTDNVPNYSWKFSSVHHWGESAYGTWTVKVADLSSSGNTTGGTLNSVTVTLYGAQHQFPPEITSATLDRSGVSFADQSLQVVSVSAMDPQGGTPTLAYQWQSSGNGVDFTNASGETAAALSVSPAHSGKLWRCAITPSNGTTSGSAYLTDAVNLVARPPAFVKTGAAFSYTPGLVLANQGGASSFRLAGNSGWVDGLLLDENTGTYSGTVTGSAPRGIRDMVIQRFDSQGQVISISFSLRVVAGSYAQWAGDHPLAKSQPPVDNDGDGLPNLVEYLLDLNANEIDTPSPVVFGQEGNVLTLTYRESKIPSDATLAPEWATALEAGAAWQSTGIATSVLEEDELFWLKKASLPITSGDPKRFLRLKATQLPP